MKITKIELEPPNLIFTFKYGEPVILFLNDEPEDPKERTCIILDTDPILRCNDLDELYSAISYINKLKMAIEFMEKHMAISVEYDGELIINGLYKDFANLQNIKQ